MKKLQSILNEPLSFFELAGVSFPYKIVQIADHQITGGAAIAGHRLFTGLKKKGVDVKLIPFVNPTHNEEGCHSWHQIFSDQRYVPSHTFSDGKLNKKQNWVEIISSVLQKEQPHIINLHNLHGSIHFREVPFEVLDAMASKSQLVFTLHDMWLLTGRCAYSTNCLKFIDETCNEECPTSNEYPQLTPNLIAKALRIKKDFFKRHPESVIVTPSKWLASEVEKSFLKELRIEVIPYGIDLSVYQPAQNRKELRNAMGIEDSEFVLLVAAANLSDPRKGMRLLWDALSRIKDNFTLLIVGRREAIPQLPDNIKLIDLGFVNNQSEMSRIYSSADIFVTPTLADNLPCVLIESIACGTPCLGFNIGGVPEVIRPGLTGWIVSDISVASLTEAIQGILVNNDNAKRLRTTCRDIAEKEYSSDLQVERYKLLFFDLLSKSPGISPKQFIYHTSRNVVVPNTQEKLCSVDHLNLQAKQALQNGYIQRAKELLTKVLNQSPNNIKALNNLAVTKILEKDWDFARNTLQKVLELDPSNNVALENVKYLENQVSSHKSLLEAEKLIEQKEFPKAREILENILEIDDKHIEALNDLAVIEISENNLSKARDILNKILQIDSLNQIAKENLEYLDRQSRTIVNNSHSNITYQAIGQANRLEEEQNSCNGKRQINEGKNIEKEILSSKFHQLDNKMVATYVQPPMGNTENYISVKPIEAFGFLISSYEALKDYHIEGFGSGFSAAEAILKHIVTNKFQSPFNINKNIWLKIVALPVKCEISSMVDGTHFDESKPASAEDISPDFVRTEGAERINAIHAYAKKMSKGDTDFGQPLYVTGAVLKQMGANANPNGIYMMDGARRIVANALNHKRYISIQLLILEEEYPLLLGNTTVQILKQKLAALSWFDKYQSIPLVGISGQRTLKRFDLIPMDNLRDQIVMDFGCNTGQACLKAIQAGAKEIIGIEGMKDTWEVAIQIKDFVGFKNLNYLNVNFNDPHFDKPIDSFFPDQVDYSFFFSVYRTKELTQRERLFRYIINKTKKGIFFEGHAHSVIDTIEYYDWLFDCFGLKYKFLGYSEGNLRPLFYLPIDKKSTSILDSTTPVNSERESFNTDAIQSTNYLVSAIVSTYKSEKFIQGKIEDLLSQSLGDRLEIIIIDSNSPENEREIVGKYVRYHKNIKYIRTDIRETVYGAWNRGIKAASGKYITNANTDDRLRSDALEILANELEKHSDIALVYADFFITNFENMTINSYIRCGYSIKPDFSPDIMLHGCHMGPQPMWRKEIHDEIGYFDEKLTAAGDYEFWCRTATKYKMKHIPEFLGLYYNNQESVTNTNIEIGVQESAKVKRMYKTKFPIPRMDLPTGYYYRKMVPKNKYVNICMVTFNRLEFTKKAVESLVRYTRYPHVITIVDNNSQDGSKEYLQELKRKGIIKNLVLLEDNIGVAKASNIAWSREPEAEYYLKLDNDIIIQKTDWLSPMVEAIDNIPKLGAIGYNFESVSYPLETIQGGYRLRVKRNANIGGACYLIPKRVERILGYWCEDYGLYGEEDGDYSYRIRLAGLFNAYMEDEEIGFHLPGGKAGRIDPLTKSALDNAELSLHSEYRIWKDKQRQFLQKRGGILERNIIAYGKHRSLYVPRGTFFGNILPNIQIFKRDDSIIFLTLSGTLQPEDLTEIEKWTKNNAINFHNSEVIIENGRNILKLTKNTLELFNRAKEPSINHEINQRCFDISIIIPVFNKVEYTQKCLTTLIQNTQEVHYEVIIVDNASTDGTQNFLKSLNGGAKIITNKENLGFARACNQGAKVASGKYLVFLNNDTEPQIGWVKNVIRDFERDDSIGIIGNKLIYQDNTIQHAGITFLKVNNKYQFWPSHRYRHKSGNDALVNNFEEVHAVTGACLFIPKDLFNTVGGFSEEYKMYFEDLDLNLKVKKTGKRIFYEPGSIVIHHEGKSSPNQMEIDRLNIQSAEIFFSKWKDFIKYLVSKHEKNTSVEIVWLAPFFNPSGYTSEAFAFTQSLADKVDLQISNISNIHSKEFIDGLALELQEILKKYFTKNINIKDKIVVYHFPAYAFSKHPDAKYSIGRTMFETDSLPKDWVDKCNLMDEIWVPSRFNAETFQKAGVIKQKIQIIHEPVDTDFFNPNNTQPYKINKLAKFNFLSVFEWSARKGWDVLLESYFAEFTRTDDVCLFLKTYLLHKPDGNVEEHIKQKIFNFADSLGLKRNSLPHFQLITKQIPYKELPSFYKAFDCLVIPSRGEGWGRPHCEAMSMELPVISTNWSGNTEFMNEHNSFLIDVDKLVEIEDSEIPFYRSHKWAQPSISHLRKLMRYVFHNSNEAKDKGIQARKDMIHNYSCKVIGDIVANRLHEINDTLNKNKRKIVTSHHEKKEPSNSNIIWEGSQFVYHSLALINRELCLQLLNSGYEISIIPYEHDQFGTEADPRFKALVACINKPLTGKIDVHVRHQWPPNLTPPPEGHWVIIQPWEFGSLPEEWVRIFSTQVDEMWVPSTYVRQVYIDSGIPAERVIVIPNGINPEKFHTEVRPYQLKTQKKFKFLFIGGTIHRKGIDLLLQAYLDTFKRSDDVCLVIKDMGGNSFYAGQTFKEKIERIQQNNNLPEIEYIEQILSETELTGLYAASNILAHPYRGEGFGLPILEAMACGIPAIVTNGGACLDFCNSKNSLLITATKKLFKEKFVGDRRTVDYPWMFEVEIEDLKEKMRFAYEHPEEMRTLGRGISSDIRNNWTWERSSKKIKERIEYLRKVPVLRHTKNNPCNQTLSVSREAELFNKADESFQKGAFHEAIDAYKKAIECNPTFFNAYYNLGLVYASIDQPDEAISTLKRAIELNSTEASAFNNLGVLYFKKNMPSDARYCFEKALSIDTNYKEAQQNLEKVNKVLAN